MASIRWISCPLRSKSRDCSRAVWAEAKRSAASESALFYGDASKGRKKPRSRGPSLFEGNADNSDVICCLCFADLDRPAGSAARALAAGCHRSDRWSRAGWRLGSAACRVSPHLEDFRQRPLSLTAAVDPVSHLSMQYSFLILGSRQRVAFG